MPFPLMPLNSNAFPVPFSPYYTMGGLISVKHRSQSALITLVKARMPIKRFAWAAGEKSSIIVIKDGRIPELGRIIFFVPVMYSCYALCEIRKSFVSTSGTHFFDDFLIGIVSIISTLPYHQYFWMRFVVLLSNPGLKVQTR